MAFLLDDLYLYKLDRFDTFCALCVSIIGINNVEMFGGERCAIELGSIRRGQRPKPTKTKSEKNQNEESCHARETLQELGFLNLDIF